MKPTRLPIPLLLLLAATIAKGDHTICLSVDGIFHYKKNCQERSGLTSEVEPAVVERRFLYLNRAQSGAAVGVLSAGATRIQDVIRTYDTTIALADWVKGPDTGEATVVLTERTKGSWTFTIDAWWFREGRLNIHVPRGVYDMTASADGRKFYEGKGIWFLPPRAKQAPRNTHAPPAIRPATVISGRALAADGKSGADLARVTLDCRRVVCEADVHGRFHCTVPRSALDAVCLEQPTFGRKRIELEGRTGRIDLGDVLLQPGPAIRVIKPLHVVLPERTTVSLMRGKTEVRQAESISGREEVEFAGLSKGKYDVVLAGPKPLQRKRFPIDVGESGVSDVPLSIDAYRLTGTLEYKKRGLPEAEVELTGELSHATLHADQSGRFNAELWAPDSFAVLVKSKEFPEPYGEMRRASVTDNDWQITVPSRRITGRVLDDETGKPIAGAIISVQSTTNNGTRWSRSIHVREDGTFNLSGVAEGRYALVARHPSYVAADPHEIDIDRMMSDQEIELRLARGVEVRVAVSDVEGKPVPEALVLHSAAPDGERMGRALTDIQGIAAVPVGAKATKTVFVLPRSGSFTYGNVSADKAETGVPLRVPEGGSSLTVVALSASGDAPLAGLRIALRYNGQFLPRAVLMALASIRGTAAVTNAEGRMSLPRLPAGQYDFALLPPASSSPVPTSWQSIVLGPGETIVTPKLTTSRRSIP